MSVRIDEWNTMHAAGSASTVAPSTPASRRDARLEAATVAKASSGQRVNQLMVQQLTSDGNMRRRLRNASPT